MTYYQRNKERMLAKQKKYRREHSEEVKTRARAYYLKNKERIRLTAIERKAEIAAKKRANRLANIERHKAKDRAYYLANRERRLAQQRYYYKANVSQVRARGKAWREANPVAVKINSKAYRESHREERAIHNAKRRALKSGTQVEAFTAKDWRDIKEAYDYRCVYCHKKEPLTQDHVIPLSKRGIHHKSNIVPACRSCNSRKNAREAPKSEAICSVMESSQFR